MRDIVKRWWLGNGNGNAMGGGCGGWGWPGFELAGRCDAVCRCVGLTGGAEGLHTMLASCRLAGHVN